MYIVLLIKMYYNILIIWGYHDKYVSFRYYLLIYPVDLNY
jgi:hypothetical protein